VLARCLRMPSLSGGVASARRARRRRSAAPSSTLPSRSTRSAS
jgi:hypothetical protein